ncbi:MBL fold metallo-hydrolase [Dehalobacter sp. DCM]|uniref:MBL fold metallo-hydrolase n=1 Tax=Dehalobacter sp. DCM TaxID=2907827 RepID=UPI003FCC5C7D|nr:MBL fold metallo-hydrolase [Dehalobacter sp. DCM]
MDIIQVKGNTFCIDTGMTYIPYYQINEEEIILLDSGWAKGERKGIDELLESRGFKVAAILCSHAHIDHVGNNAYYKEKHGSTIAMPSFEALLCSSVNHLKTFYSGQTLTEITEHYGNMICETDILISDEQEKIYLCGVKFKIIHTPGHSPAHICIVTPDNVAYLGDALISHDVMKGSKIPYAFILSEDLRSKKKLYGLRCSKYIVAHRGIYDDITDLITDNIDCYRERAERIYAVVEGAMTKEDILKAAIKKYNIQVNTIYKYAFVDRMLHSYIEYLHETGRLTLNIDHGFLKYSKADHA